MRRLAVRIAFAAPALATIVLLLDPPPAGAVFGCGINPWCMVTKGAGNSRIFELRGPMMVNHSYQDASMKVSVWQKDMAVIGEFARRLRCPTPPAPACT